MSTSSEPHPLDVRPQVPVPSPPGDDVRPTRPLRQGDLSHGWHTLFWLGWAGVTAGLAAVWYSSRITGLATWWLGPEVSPRLILINLLPFVAPLVLCLMTLSHRRWMPYWGIGGAVATALVGVLDIGRVRGYAVVECTLATAALAVTIASFAGLLRAAPAPVEVDAQATA